MHAGNHRLRQGLQRVHQAGSAGKQFARLRQTGAGHVAKVVAGREHRAVGSKDGATRGVSSANNSASTTSYVEVAVP